MAAAINLASETGREIRLDTSMYSRAVRRDPRQLELKEEGIPVQLAGLNPWVARLLGRLPGSLSAHEDHLRDTKLRPITLYATGYFQRFNSAIDALDLLQPYLERSINGELAHDSDYVAVHCRLGDYLNPETRSTHGATNPRWSISEGYQLAAELGVSNVRVFTDSPKLLSEMLGRYNSAPIQLDQSQSAWDVLSSASRAKGLVISNSSLSWWAAFIAQRIRRLPSPVVMPYPWKAQPSHLDNDLKDPSWRVSQREIL